MAFLTNGTIGADLTALVAGTGTSSNEGNQFALGTKAPGSNGTTWMYVHASGAIDQYDFVSIDENGEATAMADASGTALHTPGVAQVAFADNDFGWVCIDAPMGNVNGNILASCAADTDGLYTTATAGHLDDATSAGAVRVYGIHAVAAAAGAATNKEVMIQSARFGT